MESRSTLEPLSAQESQAGLESTAQGHLARARAAAQAEIRAKYALAGLAVAERSSETRWLLMRQLYIAHLENREYGRAGQWALEMSAYAPLSDVALHDAARAAMAQQDWAQAQIRLQEALRSAPAERQFNHGFTLARLQAFVEKPVAALGSLRRVANTAAHTDLTGCVTAAQLLWSRQAKRTVASRRLLAGYDRLAGCEPRPVLGDFLAAELLAALGQTAEAGSVYRGFLSAANLLGCVPRLSLQPEIEKATGWLLQRPAPRWFDA